MYYRYFNVYDNASDYNNANHGRTPNVSLVKDGADVHYQEIQYRTIPDSTQYVYQNEYDNAFYSRTISGLNNWQALVLPYDYIISEEDAQIYNFGEITDVFDTMGFQVIDICELYSLETSAGFKLLANTPYTFKTPRSPFTLSGHRNKFYNYNSNLSFISKSLVSPNGTIYNFYANYTNFLVTQASTYYTLNTSGNIGAFPANNSIKAYRWFFIRDTSNAAQSNSNSGLLMGGMGNPNASIGFDEDDTEFE